MSTKTTTRVFPIMHAPEGLDIWNENNNQAVAVRKQVEELVKSVAQDEMHGILLPFGWELELASFTTTKDDTEEQND